MFFNEVENFLLLCYKKKEANLLDIYFSKLLYEKNNFDYSVIMLFSFLISLSSRLGNICLPIFEILNNNIFTKYIYNFLYYFFKRYIKIFDSINILFKYNYLSSYWINNVTPFILYKDCIYLNKFWKYENYIVNFFKKNYVNKEKINNKKIFFIFKYFKKFHINIHEKICIFNVFFNKISFICGLPGTGKTTLISKLIFILFKIFKLKNKNSIKIVSFTGKSCFSLTNILKKNYILLNIKKKFYNKLPNKVITIHKLLNYNLNKIYFNNNNEIDFDILIIDEFSMIDINILYNIFILLNKNFLKIIFLGDSNQIGPIESISLLNEICNYNFSFSKKKTYLINFLLKYKFNFLKFNININKLNNNISFLLKNYRFKKNKYLNLFSNFINCNNYKEIYKFIDKFNFNNNINFYDSNKFNYNFLINFCIKKYKYYFDYLNSSNIKYNNFLNYFNKFQIISIIKKSKFGTLFLNKYINNLIIDKYIKKYILKNNKIYYIGQPIIITKNNNDLNIFNGEIGFIIYDNKKLKIFFSNFYNEYKIIFLNNFINWKLTWVITVHKSQGSEFNHVLLIIPDYSYKLLNKQILYTAITRAKKKITIYASKEIFLYGIKKKQQYYTNILNKLNI